LLRLDWYVEEDMSIVAYTLNLPARFEQLQMCQGLAEHEQ
jgi:hypothetical protein